MADEAKREVIRSLLAGYQGPEEHKRRLARILKEADFFPNEYGPLAYSLAEMQAAGGAATTAAQNQIASLVSEEFDKAYQGYVQGFQPAAPGDRPLPKSAYFAKNKEAYWDVLGRPLNAGWAREQRVPGSQQTLGEMLPQAFSAATVQGGMSWLVRSEIPHVLQQLVHLDQDDQGKINWRSVGMNFMDEVQEGIRGLYESIPSYKPPTADKKNNFAFYAGLQVSHAVRDYRKAEQAFAGGRIGLGYFEGEEGDYDMPGFGGGVDAFGAPLDASSGASAANSFTERPYLGWQEETLAKVPDLTRGAVTSFQRRNWGEDVLGAADTLNVQTGRREIDKSFSWGGYGRAGASAWEFGVDAPNLQVFGIDPDSPAGRVGMKEGAYLQSFARLMKSPQLRDIMDAVEHGNGFALAYQQPDDQGVMTDYVSVIEPFIGGARSADQGAEYNWVQEFARTLDPEVGRAVLKVQATWRSTGTAEAPSYEYVSLPPRVLETEGHNPLPVELWTTQRRYASGTYRDSQGRLRLSPLSDKPGDGYNVRVQLDAQSVYDFGALYEYEGRGWTSDKARLGTDQISQKRAEEVRRGLMLTEQIRAIQRQLTRQSAEVEPEFTIEVFSDMVEARPRLDQPVTRRAAQEIGAAQRRIITEQRAAAYQRNLEMTADPSFSLSRLARDRAYRQEVFQPYDARGSQAVDALGQLIDRQPSGDLVASAVGHQVGLDSFTRFEPTPEREGQREEVFPELLGGDPELYGELDPPDAASEGGEGSSFSIEDHNRESADPVIAARQKRGGFNPHDAELEDAHQDFSGYEDTMLYQKALGAVENPNDPFATNQAMIGQFGAIHGYVSRAGEKGKFDPLFQRLNRARPENYQSYKALEPMQYAEGRAAIRQTRTAELRNITQVARALGRDDILAHIRLGERPGDVDAPEKLTPRFALEDANDVYDLNLAWERGREDTLGEQIEAIRAGQPELYEKLRSSVLADPSGQHRAAVEWRNKMGWPANARIVPPRLMERDFFEGPLSALPAKVRQSAQNVAYQLRSDVRSAGSYVNQETHQAFREGGAPWYWDMYDSATPSQKKSLHRNIESRLDKIIAGQENADDRLTQFLKGEIYGQLMGELPTEFGYGVDERFASHFKPKVEAAPKRVSNVGSREAVEMLGGDVSVPQPEFSDIPPWENASPGYHFETGNTPADRQARAAYQYGQAVGDIAAGREKVLHPEAQYGTPQPARNLPHFTPEVEERIRAEFTEADFEESGFLIGRMNDQGGVDVFDVVKPEQRGRISKHRVSTTAEMVEEANQAAQEKGGFLAGYIHTHPGDPSQEPQYLRPSNSDVLTRSLAGQGSMHSGNWGEDSVHAIYNPQSGNMRLWNHVPGAVMDVGQAVREPSTRPARVGLRGDRQVFEGVEAWNSFDRPSNAGNFRPGAGGNGGGGRGRNGRIFDMGEPPEEPPDSPFSDFDAGEPPEEPPDLDTPPPPEGEQDDGDIGIPPGTPSRIPTAEEARRERIQDSVRRHLDTHGTQQNVDVLRERMARYERGLADLSQRQMAGEDVGDKIRTIAEKRRSVVRGMTDDELLATMPDADRRIVDADNFGLSQLASPQGREFHSRVVAADSRRVEPAPNSNGRTTPPTRKTTTDPGDFPVRPQSGWTLERIVPVRDTQGNWSERIEHFEAVPFGAGTERHLGWGRLDEQTGRYEEATNLEWGTITTPEEGHEPIADVSFDEIREYHAERLAQDLPARRLTRRERAHFPTAEENAIAAARGVSLEQALQGEYSRMLGGFQRNYDPKKKQFSGSAVFSRADVDGAELVTLNELQVQHAYDVAQGAVPTGFQGALPGNDLNKVASIKDRIRAAAMEQIDREVEDLIARGDDPSIARGYGGDMKEAVGKIVGKLGDKVVSTLSRELGIDSKDVKEISASDQRLRSVDEVKGLVERSPAVARQLNGYTPEEIWAQGKSFIVTDEGGHDFDIGSGGYRRAGGRSYNPNNGMGIFQGKFGAAMYAGYMLTREWQMMMGQHMQQAEAYGKYLSQMGVVALPEGVEAGATDVGYLARQQVGAHYMGQAAYQVFGGFQDIPFLMSGAGTAPARLLTNASMAGGIAGGGYILGAGLSMMAGGTGAMATIGGALGPVGLGVGATILGGSLLMEAYNAIAKPEDPVTWGNMFRGAEQGYIREKGRGAAVDAAFGKSWKERPDTMKDWDYATYAQYRNQYSSQLTDAQIAEHVTWQEAQILQYQGTPEDVAEMMDAAGRLTVTTGESMEDIQAGYYMQKRLTGKLDTGKFAEDVSRIAVSRGMTSGMLLTEAGQYAALSGYAPGSAEFEEAFRQYANEPDLGRSELMSYEARSWSQVGSQIQALMPAGDTSFYGRGIQIAKQYSINNQRRAAVFQSITSSAQQYQLEDLTDGQFERIASITASSSPYVGGVIAQAMDQYQLAGGSFGGALDLGSGLSNVGMSEQEAFLYDRMMGGDLKAYSFQAWQSGNLDSAFFDRSGQSITQYYGSVANQVYNAWAPRVGLTSKTDAQFLGTSNPQILAAWNAPGGRGGFYGLQKLANQRSYEASMASIGVQMRGIALQENFYWGAGSGGTWDSPTSGSAWGIEDRQLAFQHESTLAGFADQWARMTLGNAFAVQRERNQWDRMQSSHAFSQWQWSAQYNQFQKQQVWTQQDWQYQDTTRGMNFGWQMEDLNEAIRFASGRERRQLMRQRDRAALSYNLEEEQIETQRDRQQELWAAQEEQYQKQKQYMNEMQRLDQESFAINKKQREEFYKLDVQSYERRIKEYEEEKKLSDELRELQRKFQYDQLQLQKEAAGAQAAAAAAQKEINDAILEGQKNWEELTGTIEQMNTYSNAFRIAQATTEFVRTLDRVSEVRINKLIELIRAIGTGGNNSPTWERE